MRPPRPVPPHLAWRAFSRSEAVDAGITPRMLQHPRFVQVHPSVYRLGAVDLDERGRIAAARLALPPDARISHATRLRMLGVERGPLLPLHFTVPRDLHLDLPGIVLHRTVVMPPHDDDAVSVEAAFIGYVASARLVDRVVVGDWLLHRGFTSVGRLLALADAQSWRPGVAELREVVPLLDSRSRSIPESEVRVCLQAAGLPRPEVNVDVHDDAGSFVACGDLLYRLWRLLIEYEGGQHFTDADQIASDVDRYARVRREGWSYVQVTKKHLRAPKAMVGRVHRELVSAGYDGPSPVFGSMWDELFRQPKPRPRRRKVDPQPSELPDGCRSTSSGPRTS
ncbi:hypothetical protein [Aeromicrobium sp. Root472D3]|uniref:hypothetical protein n=1 Tax=Aeromicrobium sp. Root472D3 TaxID=1736540 RepID=UPI000A744CB5|nr:hypothetical protein [Aeromicrobium sp. Root472D3]